MGREETQPIKTFLSFETIKTVTLTEAQVESALKIKELLKLHDEFHLRVQSKIVSYRQKARDAASRGQLPNFTGDYVLVAKSDFHAGKKLCLCWRSPRRVTKALNYYV